jgi:hypothetical protein
LLLLSLERENDLVVIKNVLVVVIRESILVVVIRERILSVIKYSFCH